MTGSTAPLNVTGLLTVSGPMSLLGGTATVGALTLNAGMTTDIFDVNGQSLTVGGGAVMLTQGVPEVDGATTNLGTGAMSANANASVSHTGGTIQLGNSTQPLPLATLSAYTSGAGTTTQLTGGATQTLQVANAGELNVAGTMKVWDDFLVEIDGGTVITTDLDLTGV